MKLYMINNTRKLKKIKKYIEDNYDITIDDKEISSLKMTKNDYVIVSDEVSKLDDSDKLKNIILLTKNKDYKYIWNMANNYKTIDIIDNDLDESYIANRIINNIA